MTDAMTWETVIVLVIVAVEVRVVVDVIDADCAAARRGRRSTVEMVGNFISISCCWQDLRKVDRNI